MNHALGVDIGGSHTKVALVSSAGVANVVAMIFNQVPAADHAALSRIVLQRLGGKKKAK